MNRITLLVVFFILWAWSAPNVDRFAQIFGKEIDINEESVSGYIDDDGKLWVLGIRFKSELTKKRSYTGDIWVPEDVPYLYFWLYDKNGNKINEDALGDSVARANLIPLENGGALIIPRTNTDIGIRMTDPPGGYLTLVLMDKDGVVKQQQKLLQPLLKNAYVRDIAIDDKDKIYVTFINRANIAGVYIENDRINLKEDVPLLQPPTTGRETHILEILKKNIPFVWTQVDTATRYKENGEVDYRNVILFKDKIQIPHCDIESQKWEVKRYHIPHLSIRKFKDFDLYRLRSNPTIKDYPEVQSARLKNGNIVVTIFMKGNDKPVAYQMLFDSFGQHIAPEKMDVLKPEDVKKIPDGSKMYIKREPASRDKSGKFKGANVYIWGYDREDGMLYWKKYHVD